MFKDYNMNQIILPLDLEVKLQNNDIAFHVHHLVESIPHEAFEPFLRNEGCPAYHPRMMLKIILCAYTQSVFSGRKIEALVKDSIRMMWLAQGYEPSYRTINRFRVRPEVKELLRQCFVQFRCRLVEEKLIDQEAIFIDGTKIEANANKFTFVWKKSVKRYHQGLIEKTDHDATFMRMKEDYMKNGQLKAGYNVQIATENQYTLAYEIYPNPTDTRTLIPFLDTIEDHYFELPEHIVADAGYGSEQNYEDIISRRDREALITYNQYIQEQKRAFKKNAFQTANWPYDEEKDVYTCPNQRSLTYQYDTVKTNASGFKQTFKVYECENCTDCPFRSRCTKAKIGNHRKMMVNEKWVNQKNM